MKNFSLSKFSAFAVLLVLCLTAQFASAQEEESMSFFEKGDLRVGFKFGLNVPSYSFGDMEDDMEFNTFFSGTGGLVFEQFNTKYYSYKIEVLYSNRGFNEKVEDVGTAKFRQHAAEIHFMPAVFKLGTKGLSPFVGVGAYGGMVLATSYELNDVDLMDFRSLDVNKVDYGLSFSAGFYINKCPLDIRYQMGLSEVFNDKELQGVKYNTVTVSLTL